MYSAPNHQPAAAPGLRASSASRRASTKLIPFPTRSRRRHGSDEGSGESDDDRLSFSEDDFLDLPPEEVNAAAAFQAMLPGLRSPTSPHDSHILPLILRPRISISRVWHLAPHSTQDPLKHAAHDGSDCTTATVVDDRPLAHPAHPASPRPGDQLLPGYKRSSIQSILIDQAPDTFHNSDPFRKDGPAHGAAHHPPLVPVSPLRVAHAAPADPNLIPPSPPSTRPPSPAHTLTPSLAISSAGANPLLRGFRRLKTLSRAKSARAAHSQRGAGAPGAAARAQAAGTPPPRFLPELSFDAAPFWDIAPFERDEPESHSDPPSAASADHATPVERRSSPEASAAPPAFPLIKWACVDPATLTPSPYAPTATDISPAETPLLVPSPSWLSRNTADIDPRRAAAPSPLISVTPPSPASPAPLPILPRSLLPVPPRSSVPPSPCEAFSSENSSVTLYTAERRPRPTLTIPSAFPPLINRLTPTQLRHSLADKRSSIRSFLTYASLALGDKDSPLLTSITQDSPNQARFFLLLHPPSRQTSPTDAQPSPLPLPLRITFAGSRSRINTPVDPHPHHHQVFTPAPGAFAASRDTFPLPNYLRALATNASRLSQNVREMDQAYGKPADTVDWGDEVDYSGYEWFKDPPPRPEPAPPQAPAEPYIPQPGVIEQNDMFDFALKSAPNVLLSRYKQYGQLGVLAWCSEFGEMIDALKQLGFEGNMFVSTRTQALKTCEEILALNLDIEMQIIVMYLSSQVARLRRFLDAERTFNDYPQPKFPIDPNIEYMK